MIGSGNIKAKLKNKQDLTFLVLGILMSILVFACVFYSVDFLTLKIKKVLNIGRMTETTPVKFDIEKIEALEIQKIQK